MSEVATGNASATPPSGCGARVSNTGYPATSNGNGNGFAAAGSGRPRKSPRSSVSSPAPSANEPAKICPKVWSAKSSRPEAADTACTDYAMAARDPASRQDRAAGARNEPTTPHRRNKVQHETRDFEAGHASAPGTSDCP